MSPARGIRLALLVFLLSAAALSVGTPSEAARKGETSLRVPLPARGHISVVVLEATFTSERRRMPRRLRLRPRRLRALPPTARILVAQRRLKRRGKTIYRLALLAVNVAQPTASTAQEQPKLLNFSGFPAESQLFLFFAQPLGLETALMQEESRQYQLLFQVKGGANVDRQPTLAQILDNAVDKVIDPNGDGKVDRGLDTGHYDDGHSFGWDRKPVRQQTWAELVDANLEQYNAVVEERLKEDVNGDGTIGGGPSGGGQIDTQADQPVITGGL